MMFLLLSSFVLNCVLINQVVVDRSKLEIKPEEVKEVIIVPRCPAFKGLCELEK